MANKARKLIFFVLLASVSLVQCGLAATTKHTSTHKSTTIHPAKTSHKKATTTSSKKTTSHKSSHHSTPKKTTPTSTKSTHTNKITSKTPKPPTQTASLKTPIPSPSTKKQDKHTSSKHKSTGVGLHATNLQHHHHSSSHSTHHLAYSKSIRLALADIPQESINFANEIEHGVANLSSMVNKTIQTMRYSHYRMGGTDFDPSHGIYVVDCSSYVDRLLNQVNPEAYFNLVNRTGTTRPTTSDYYNFFNNLAYQSSHYWRKVDNANNLQAGDILVFRSGWNGGGSGHVMVVMNKPVRRNDVLMVRVADSASSGHSQDTRPAHTSGIGIGTMLIKVDDATNRPAAYAWRVGAPWENVQFAMGRPMA